MAEAAQPVGRRAALLCLSFVAAFLLGVAVGVGLDRAVLAPRQPAVSDIPVPGAPASPRQLLVGHWLAENGARTAFQADGSFDEFYKETVPNAGPDGIVDFQKPVIERDARITGQYHWVSDETIEVKVQGKAARRLRIVLDGDKLTVFGDDGSVSRFKRSGP